jgi:serine/threonine-protein kinase
MLILFYITIFGGTLLFAWFNLRAGRGDLKGGLKIAGFVVVFYFLSSLIMADHVASAAEVRILNLIISDSLYSGALAGILYVALEPYARRFWPETLISWNRLLKGDFRDPMIGRDILIGGAGLFGLGLLRAPVLLIGSYLYEETLIDGLFFEFSLNGWWGAIANLLRNSIFGVIIGLGLLFLLVLPYVIFRSKKMSVVFYVLATYLFSLPFFLSAGWSTIILSFLSTLVSVFILTRFGLLAMICGALLLRTSDALIFVFDPSSYLFPGTVLVLAFVFGLVIYGFSISTAGQPVFGNVFSDDGKK